MPLNPRLSLGSWAFSFGPFAPAPWPFDRFVQYAAGAGYDGVQINGFPPHPHPDDYDTPAKCRTLRQRLDATGLGVSAYRGWIVFEDECKDAVQDPDGVTRKDGGIIRTTVSGWTEDAWAPCASIRSQWSS